MSELEGLWRAVHEARDDDAPRRVLADRLQERGDPRGEFINLQLARQASGRRASGRERELLRRHGDAWADDRRIARKGRVWRRGFLWGGALRREPKAGELISGWSLVEELDLRGGLPSAAQLELLEHPLTRPRAIWGVRRHAHFLPTGLRLRRLGVVDVYPGLALELGQQRLELLHLRAGEAGRFDATGLASVLAWPSLARVERLVLQVAEMGAALEALRAHGRAAGVTLEPWGSVPPANHVGWALDCRWDDGWCLTARPGKVRSASDFQLAMLLEHQLAPAGCRRLAVRCDQPTSMLARGAWTSTRMTADELGIELELPRRGE